MVIHVVSLYPQVRSGPRLLFAHVMTSTFVLPGNVVPARTDSQKGLKLGPGLLQVSSDASPSAQDLIIATRAGTLNSSDNGRLWWVEKNTLRVRTLELICTSG
jgi:hypothetical protein